MGMPGFDQVLEAVADAWTNRREKAIEQAGMLTEHLHELNGALAGQGALHARLLEGAAAVLERIFDHAHGGFGQAPKFPHPMDVRLLLHVWRRNRKPLLLDMARLTLDKMAGGGMYDQLGGGFHRYSVDDHWLVPHFEKMLYDNALLTVSYLEGYQATGNERYAQVAREICDYVLREMTDAGGGFYSTQDADSEGEEGKFFVWSLQEVEHLLGAADKEPAKTFCYVYDVTQQGNWEDRNILNMPKTLEQCATILGRAMPELESELAAGRAKLLEVRERRMHPGLDDKMLASWNGLMIDSLAQATAVLNEPKYLLAATQACEFIFKTLIQADGRLLHSARHGKAHLNAYLDDYACVINGLVSVYEAGFDERWIDRAVLLADTMLALFRDESQGGFYFTSSDHEALISRQKDLQDNATPSGNSMAATALLRLGKLTGRSDYQAVAEETLRIAAGIMQQSPTAAGQMLLAYDFYLGPTPEIVLIGSLDSHDTQAMLTDLRRRYLPNKVVALRDGGGAQRSNALDALFAGRTAAGHEPTAYICQNFTCQAPVSGQAAAIAAWHELEQQPSG